MGMTCERLRMTAGAAVALLCGPLSLAGTNSWTSTGPDGSYVRVQYSADASVAFARGGDKFWKSSDAGVSWSVKLSGNTDDASFAVDPSNPNIVVVQGPGGGPGLLRSLDAGEHFSTVNPMSANVLKFSPDGSALYAVLTSVTPAPWRST